MNKYFIIFFVLLIVSGCIFPIQEVKEKEAADLVEDNDFYPNVDEDPILEEIYDNIEISYDEIENFDETTVVDYNKNQVLFFGDFKIIYWELLTQDINKDTVNYVLENKDTFNTKKPWNLFVLDFGEKYYVNTLNLDEYITNYTFDTFGNKEDYDVYYTELIGSKQDMKNVLTDMISSANKEGKLFKMANPQCGPNNPQKCEFGFVVMLDFKKLKEESPEKFAKLPKIRMTVKKSRQVFETELFEEDDERYIFMQGSNIFVEVAEKFQ